MEFHPLKLPRTWVLSDRSTRYRLNRRIHDPTKPSRQLLVSIYAEDQQTWLRDGNVIDLRPQIARNGYREKATHPRVLLSHWDCTIAARRMSVSENLSEYVVQSLQDGTVC